jgi:hypothetical protein
MRLDHLIDRLLASVAQERLLLRRITRYLLPLLLPVGFALAQMARSWVGLAAGGLGALMLMLQIEMFLRPTLERARVTDADMTFYLGLPRDGERPSLAPAVPLLVPAALTLAASMAVFLPTILAPAAPWQRLLSLALGLGALYAIWQRLAEISALLDSIDRRLIVARSNMLTNDCTGVQLNAPTTTNDQKPPFRPSSLVFRPTEDGLLDPDIAVRIAGMPLPPQPISPAAKALLRDEVYMILRDIPRTTDRELLGALNDLAQQAHADELRHWLLPPVGGKIYLPIAADGSVAHMLAATVRRLGMDGAYSASLGTWLVRLPPARSYAVAGRLIDAVLALGLPPPGAILPHHLTVQGELGQDSKLLSIVHLIATPLLFSERPGHAQGDDRPFIMRGGGVLDDMGGRGRGRGRRTDFVDGFIFAGTPGLGGVEHLTAHTINLRIKQVLAFGLHARLRSADRRAPIELSAAAAYLRLRDDTRALLAPYGLETMLDIAWLDGRWSEVWPLIQRMSAIKERDTSFLDAAQRLRDTALEAIERLAVEATRGVRG